MITKNIDYYKIKASILEDFLKLLLPFFSSIAINIESNIINIIVIIISDSRYNANLALDFRIRLSIIYRKVFNNFFRTLDSKND